MDIKNWLRRLNHHHNELCTCNNKVDLHLLELIAAKDRIIEKCKLVEEQLLKGTDNPTTL